jgi:hypothetical protein
MFIPSKHVTGYEPFPYFEKAPESPHLHQVPRGSLRVAFWTIWTSQRIGGHVLLRCKCRVTRDSQHRQPRLFNGAWWTISPWFSIFFSRAPDVRFEFVIIRAMEPNPDFFWGVSWSTVHLPQLKPLTGLVHHTWTAAELRSWLAFAVDFNSIFPNFHPA